MLQTNIEASSRQHSYVPELDGLRGVAILMVVGFHAGLPGFKNGGYLGVDVFFVLSGYLITSILLRERNEKGVINLLGFYFRRTLRLAPALIGLCLALVVAMPLVNNSSQVRIDLLSALGYVANWTRAFDLGTPMYLGHVWSLAIEEQFYLFWPLLFVAILLWFRQRDAIKIVLLLAAASWSWRALLFIQGTSVNRLYNGTDTRLDALFIGCALALALSIRGVRSYYPTNRVNFAAVVAIPAFVVLYTLFKYDSPFMYLAGFGIVSLSAAALISACVSESDSVLRKAFRVRPLVYIGKISYSLYLWHYPVFLIVWLKWGQADQSLVWLTIPFVFAISAASYHLIEQPCLRWRATVTGRRLQILGAGALAVSLGLMTGAVGYFFR
jgi:peptidoglycan/LPS O-acetylase OafA/YrhL